MSLMKQLVVRVLPITLFLLFAVAFRLSAQTDAVQPKVTKEFVTTLDGAVIDIVKGAVTIDLYIQKSARSGWTQVDLNGADAGNTKSVPQPADAASTNDVVLSQPNTYQIKLRITMDGDRAANVTFR